MAKKHPSKWRAVQLPKELVDQIEVCLELDFVKSNGITSISQFISNLVREEFQKINAYMNFDRRLIAGELINMFGDVLSFEREDKDELIAGNMDAYNIYYEKYKLENLFIHQNRHVLDMLVSYYHKHKAGGLDDSEKNTIKKIVEELQKQK